MSTSQGNVQNPQAESPLSQAAANHPLHNTPVVAGSQTPLDQRADGGAILAELFGNSPDFVAKHPQQAREALKAVRANPANSILNAIPGLMATPEEAKPATQKDPVPETITPPIPPSDVPPAPIEEPKTDDTPPLDGEEVVPEVASLQKSYKELNKTFKETRKTAEALAKEKEELAAKVQAYESGEKNPEVFEQLQSRVRELETLEEHVNFKKTDAYKKKFVEPLNKVTSELVELAETYQLPHEVLEQAVNLKNERELNSFLLDHFDDLGAIEAKSKIKDVQKLRSELASFEAKPEGFYGKIKEDYALQESLEREEREKKINEIGKNAWAKSLYKIREEGKIQELIPRDNDKEFNDKWVKPIQDAAAQNYGKMMAALNQSGVKNVDPDLMEALSTQSLLATAASTAIARANAAEERIAELEKNIDRSSKFFRPTPGNTGTGVKASAPIDTTAKATDAHKRVGSEILAAAGIVPGRR